MAKNVIGLDIGGTKITGIVFDGKNILDELTIVTPKNLFEFERNLLKLADFLSAKAKISAIGVGMAGLVDPEKGVVKYSPNIKFIKSLRLIELFKLRGFKNIKIDNDASCFTRAEMLLGQGKKFKNFLGMTLGTGVGGGIVINGQLYRGENNLGGELGHMFVDNGFLESHFKNYRDRRDYPRLGRLMGKSFANLINIFAPQAIILGGSVSQHAHAKFLPAAKKEMKKFLFNEKAEVKILVSKLKNAGALGATLLVRNLF